LSISRAGLGGILNTPAMKMTRAKSLLQKSLIYRRASLKKSVKIDIPDDPVDSAGYVIYILTFIYTYIYVYIYMYKYTSIPQSHVY
jgi:hypothetical protein